jgi:hypothetical protein
MAAICDEDVRPIMSCLRTKVETFFIPRGEHSTSKISSSFVQDQS